MRPIHIALLLVAISAPARAQVETVAQVRSELVARGVDLTDSCGAFEVTRRVAWRLRTQGVGLLAKPSGNNCQGYSVDRIIYVDGRSYDILVDAGGQNGPAWGSLEILDPGLYRAPMDPGDAPIVTPPDVPPPVTPPTLTIDFSQVFARQDAQYALLEREVIPRIDRLEAQLAKHDDEPMWIARVLGNRYVQMVGAAAAAWVTAQQAR